MSTSPTRKAKAYAAMTLYRKGDLHKSLDRWQVEQVKEIGACAFKAGWKSAMLRATPGLQPIETAPRDGTFVLVAGPSGYIDTPLRFAACRYAPGYADPWRDHAGDGFEDGGPAPTHWMPLPKEAKL